MPVNDWQAWAIDITAQLADLKRRVLAIEVQQPEWKSILVDIRTVLSLVTNQIAVVLLKEEKIAAQIEHLARAALEDTELAKMKADLAATEQPLQDSINQQGPV